MIVVTESLWASLLDFFNNTTAIVERVAYLDGFNCDTLGIATTLTAPNAIRERLRYRVPAAAMSEAGQHLLTYGMRRLAQVHTHENDLLDHSPVDDGSAYSQKVGAVSIVVPYHARYRPTARACGVHVRSREGWERVDPDCTIMLVPSFQLFQR